MPSPTGTSSAWAVAALLLLTPAASAQEDGVTYDPDSPAGRQYGLPLADAPTLAEPKAKTAKSAKSAAEPAATAGGTAAPARVPKPADDGVVLFGAGIKEATAPEQRKDTASTPPKGDRKPRAAASSSGTAATETAAPGRASVSSGPSSTSVSLGAGALVLVLGLLAGYALRSTDKSRRAGPA